MTESDANLDLPALVSGTGIGEDEDFSERDNLGFGGFGERMAKSILSLSGEPLVMMLEGPWGSGKTVFIKQWAALMRNRGCSVIRMDAFAVDYMQDPLVAIAGEIATLATSESKSEELKSLIAKFVKNFALSASSNAVQHFTGGLVDIKGVYEQSAGLVEGRVDGYVKERAALSELQKSLTEMAEEASGKDSGDSKKPLVFIVDELDRCRPDFALGILEAIKHFFSVRGVHFVLVADRTQIEDSIKHVYGCDPDRAKVYLEKFFLFSLRIPSARTNAPFSGANYKYVDYLAGEYGTDATRWPIDALHLLAFSSTKMSLRDIGKIMLLLRLSGALDNETDAYLCTFPAFMKVLSPDRYGQLLSGHLPADESLKFLMEHVQAVKKTRNQQYDDLVRGMQNAFIGWSLLLGAERTDPMFNFLDLGKQIPIGQILVDYQGIIALIDEGLTDANLLPKDPSVLDKMSERLETINLSG